MSEANGVEVGRIQPALTVEQQLDQALNLPVTMLTRGACLSIQGVTPDRILIALCRCYGRVIGMNFGVGDLAPLLKLRAEAKKAFEDAMNSVKPQPAPPQMQRPPQPMQRPQ